MGSLNERFIKSVETFSNRIAISVKTDTGWSEFTYREFYTKVRGLAFFISSQGIKKSDRVAIILDNSPEWAMIFFALSYIGAVAVPLDQRSSDKDIENIIADCGAKLRFVSKENQVLPLPDKDLSIPEDFKMADVSPDDLMLILYTSGTTDVPKGVMLTHKNLCANCDSLTKLRIFSQNDIILSVLPLYHSYPLMTTLILPVLSGARIIYVPSDWPERLVEYMKESNPTIFIGVPQIFSMMYNRMTNRIKELAVLPRLYIKFATSLGLARILLPKLRNAFGKNLRFFVSGGAKLDKVVGDGFLKFGFKILEGYGLTETSPVVSFNPLNRPKPGSVGKALPDVKIKTVDKDPSGIGEIAIQGPNVMRGYYKDEEKTKASIKDGWFLSGDLGYMDKDGYLYITGRSKEVIVLSSGKNVYPDEIEKHYSASPYVKEICVLGILKHVGKTRLEYLHAVVVPDLEFFRQRGEMNIRRAMANNLENLSKELPPYKHVMGFTITKEDLPRTVLGKIKRYEVEKRFLPIILNEEREVEVTPEEKDLSESDTAKKLIECIKETLHIKTAVNLRDSIELDLGVDSLGRVELLCAVERCFNIDLPEEMIAAEIFTVKDLLFKVEEAVEKEHKGRSAEVHKKALLEKRAVSWPEILRQPLSEEFQKKILLYPGWFDYILTFFVKGIVTLFFKIFYNLKVEGALNLPKKGPYVLCVNHTSFFDGFIISASVPFRIGLHLFFIGFRRYFIVPVVRNLVRRARIIPIDATEIVDAMQCSAFVLNHGNILCIFPEGERSIDGEVKEFRKGIGVVSRELNTALLPVFIKGAFQAWPRTERFPRLHPIEVRFGELLEPDALIEKGRGLGAKTEYDTICVAIREELLKLR